MNIPLDRLYHYIRDIAQEIYGDRIIIYRFWPHGSKNINDLHNLNEGKDGSLGENEWCKKAIFPLLWCNDQEPLNYNFYKANTRTRSGEWTHILKSINLYTSPKNLNYNRSSVFKKSLLLHSEKRSPNLKNYQTDGELIPVYYWSHAVIARDWFRYAEHVSQTKKTNKTFLIYNRAWAGTREYRLRFTELLIHLNLQEHCKTSINPIEPELGMHYDSHQFENPAWRPRTVLENHFPISQAHSHYSADFDIEDYESTNIEVVLETLFDDSRLHLTEKSLRPIAVGQPFILAGTAGSLEYLRSYGFKTFSSVWDESYDLVEDPAERLIQIAELMKYISTWLPHQRERNMAQAQAIADYNQRHFFSQEFFNQVTNELKTNLTSAFEQLDYPENYKINYWNQLASIPAMIEFVLANQDTHLPTKLDLDLILNFLKNKTH
jgi:hypothetical protein